MSINTNKQKVGSLSGEGNGTPLQYSCLENPMEGGTWKAAVHGIAEGRTNWENRVDLYTWCVLKSVQPCPILCNPMNCSPPGSSVHGTVQARILEWAAISFSNA